MTTKYPRWKDNVWKEGPANGIVVRIMRDESWHIEAIFVYFYNTKQIEEFSIEDFEGTWTDSFGGRWMLS